MDRETHINNVKNRTADFIFEAISKIASANRAAPSPSSIGILVPADMFSFLSFHLGANGINTYPFRVKNINSNCDREVFYEDYPIVIGYEYSVVVYYKYPYLDSHTKEPLIVKGDLEKPKITYSDDNLSSVKVEATLKISAMEVLFQES